MLMGTAALASARGKAEQSEILQVPAARVRQALVELPGVSEPMVQGVSSCAANALSEIAISAGCEFFRLTTPGKGVNSTIFWIRIIFPIA